MKTTHRVSLVISLSLLFAICTSTGCKKSGGGGGGGSGGGVSPQPENAYTGDPGKLGGDWVGTNSSGGEVSFTVIDGYINDFSNKWNTSPSLQSHQSGQKIITAQERLLIDPNEGTFYGFLGNILLSGEFVSNDSATGEIKDFTANSKLPSLTWTGSLKIPRPENEKVRIKVKKDFELGVIDTGTGIRICEENESICAASFLPGTNVTLIPKTLSSLYTFDGWNSDGECSSFGKNNCQLKVNKNVDLTANFNEINVDGIYQGMTDEGKPVLISVSNNVVRVRSKVEMGKSKCVFDVDKTDDVPIRYSTTFESLFYFIDDYNLALVVSGVFTGPNSVKGTISLDTKKIAGTPPECLDSKYIHFSNGGNSSIAALSFSNMDIMGQELEAKRIYAAIRERR